MCRIILFNLKESSDGLVIVTKEFFKLPDLHLLIKQKSPSLPRNLVLFARKVNLLYLIYLTGPGMLSSASDKTKLFPKNFSKNYNLDDSGISSLSFCSRTNLKLYIFVTEDG